MGRDAVRLRGLSQALCAVAVTPGIAHFVSHLAEVARQVNDLAYNTANTKEVTARVVCPVILQKWV